MVSSGSAGTGQWRSVGGARAASGEGPAADSGSNRTRFAARRVGVAAGLFHRTNVPYLRKIDVAASMTRLHALRVQGAVGIVEDGPLEVLSQQGPAPAWSAPACLLGAAYASFPTR